MGMTSELSVDQRTSWCSGYDLSPQQQCQIHPRDVPPSRNLARRALEFSLCLCVCVCQEQVLQFFHCCLSTFAFPAWASSGLPGSDASSLTPKPGYEDKNIQSQVWGNGSINNSITRGAEICTSLDLRVSFSRSIYELLKPHRKQWHREGLRTLPKDNIWLPHLCVHTGTCKFTQIHILQKTLKFCKGDDQLIFLCCGMSFSLYIPPSFSYFYVYSLHTYL